MPTKPEDPIEEIDDQIIETPNGKIEVTEIKTKKKILESRRMVYLLALLIAIVAWFLVNVYVSPNFQIRKSGITVHLDTNSSILNQYGLIPVDWNDKQMASVQVSGDRLEVAKLTPEDFVAEVNLSRVTDEGTYSLPITISLKSENYGIEVNQQSISPQTVTVRFEKLGKKKLDLTFDDSSLKIPEDYVKGTTVLSPSSINLTGGADELEKIVSAEVVVTDMPTEATDTVTLTGKVVLYDAAGKEIKPDGQKISLDKDEVSITIPVFMIKELPLKVIYSNVPSDFPIEALKFKLSQDTIRIAGPQKTLDRLTEVAIGPVDLSKLGPNTTLTLPIDSLPSDVKEMDGIENITGTLDMPNLSSMELTTTDIQVINAPVGYEVKVKSSSVRNLTIVGDADVLKTLSGSDIVAMVDLSDRTVSEGQMTVPVKILIPNTVAPVWAIYEDTPTVVISVTKTESSSTTNSSK